MGGGVKAWASNTILKIYCRSFSVYLVVDEANRRVSKEKIR